MTAFGETDEKSAMFTGKPYIGDLGYAFLFRNYRPGLGKWQTSDPLGYPDGWNNFAYCNNELILAFDFLGALTTFYPNGNPYTKQEQRNHATHIHNNKTCETYDLYEASFQEGFNVTYTTIQTAAGAVLDWAKNFLTQIQVAAVTAGTYAVYSPTPVDDGAIVIIIAATTLSKESLIPYLESHMSDTFSRVVIDSYERATKQLTNWKKIKTVHSVEE